MSKPLKEIIEHIEKEYKIDGYGRGTEATSREGYVLTPPTYDELLESLKDNYIKIDLKLVSGITETVVRSETENWHDRESSFINDDGAITEVVIRKELIEERKNLKTLFLSTENASTYVAILSETTYIPGSCSSPDSSHVSYIKLFFDRRGTQMLYDVLSVDDIHRLGI